MDILEYYANEPHATSYTAFSGRLCLRTFANIEWYLMICKKNKLNPELKNGYYTSKGDGFEFEYIEGDCILALKHNKYKVFDGITLDYLGELEANKIKKFYFNFAPLKNGGYKTDYILIYKKEGGK